MLISLKTHPDCLGLKTSHSDAQNRRLISSYPPRRAVSARLDIALTTTPEGGGGLVRVTDVVIHKGEHSSRLPPTFPLQ